MEHIYYFQEDGPSEEKIYEACKTSIAKLDDLDNEEKVQKGEHPYVSAIILDKDGNILKDDKGKELIELTDPETKKHAEAKLIERLLLAGNIDDLINRAQNKDDLLNRAHTLITTLEPCATRDTTKHPEEIACAKLIAYAGIKQVIVGMLDPAIEVRGRGLNILDYWGISYTFFPFSLIKEVKKKNKKYIDRSNKESTTKISKRIYNPNAEVELMNAPRSIRNFMGDDSNQKSLREIFNKFFERYPTEDFKKYCIEYNCKDYIKYYPRLGWYDLGEFIASQYQDQTIQDYLNKIKRDHIQDYLNNIDQTIKDYLNYLKMIKGYHIQDYLNNIDQTIKDYLNYLKMIKGYQIADINFTMYEKIAQYLGIDIHIEKSDRDALILFYVLQWEYINYF